jgi:hypothetical protein
MRCIPEHARQAVKCRSLHSLHGLACIKHRETYFYIEVRLWRAWRDRWIATATSCTSVWTSNTPLHGYFQLQCPHPVPLYDVPAGRIAYTVRLSQTLTWFSLDPPGEQTEQISSIWNPSTRIWEVHGSTLGLDKATQDRILVVVGE